MTVEQQSEFPGGIQEMVKFIHTNLKYPSGAPEGDVSVKVQTKFVVDTTGKLMNFSIEKSSGNALLDQEALRLLKTMPNWTPARMNGKKILCYFNLPIGFRVKESIDNKARNSRGTYLDNYEKANKFFEEKDFAKAKEHFLKAYNANNFNVDLATNLGTSYIKLDKKDSACVVWDKAKKELASIQAEKWIKEFCN